MNNNLPEYCYDINNVSGGIVKLKRGESGYYQLDQDIVQPYLEAHPNKTKEDVCVELNEHIGVTPEQRMAMSMGSMFGWDIPGANPSTYSK
jgi:hypothetical protein